MITMKPVETYFDTSLLQNYFSKIISYIFFYFIFTFFLLFLFLIHSSQLNHQKRHITQK